VRASVKPHSSNSRNGKPFPDFADCTNDFREANTIVEQFGDLTGAGEVTKAETTISLIQ
jgi:hypothetical protein